MNKSKVIQSSRDLSSPNRNIVPATTELDDEGHLRIGGCKLSALAAKYDTPLYILDEVTLRLACKAYRESLKKHYPGNSLALYASKANSSLVISSIIASEGLGLDAVSEGELITAIRGGLSADKIVLHGNNKSEEELRLAYEYGVIIVIDNQYDIERIEHIVSSDGPPAKLMLRFTPGIECHTHEYIKTGHLDSKFGFDPEELEEVLNQLKNVPWATLTGLHAHIGSQIFELEPHRDLAGVMCDALLLARNLGHPVKDLNVGGGLGVRYLDSDDPPTVDKWISVVSEAVSKGCHSRGLELPRLLCEPGRSIVATAGVTIYRIGSSKNVPGIRRYISVDGGMSDNPRPITYQSQYSACLADRPLENASEKVTVAGKHCESGDVLMTDLLLPKCNSGEVLVVFGTGAYNNSMSSNYNRIPRPAAIIVDNGESELVQRREELDDLLRHDVLPDRFIQRGSVSLD